MGYKRGTTSELIRFFGTILMVVVPLQFSQQMATGLEKRFSLPLVPAQIVSFGILVAITFLLSKMLVDFLQDVVKFKFTETIDKVCGLCFGAARGLLFASVILVLFHISEVEDLMLGIKGSMMGSLTRDFAFYLHSLFFF